MRWSFGYQWQKTAVDSSVQLPSLQQSQSAVYIQASADSVPMLHPEFVLRREWVGGEDGSLLGLGVTAVPSDYFSVYAKSSWYDRFPSIQEQYWRDSLLIRPASLKKEHHVFIRSGFLFRPSDNISINLEIFRRTITDAILYQPSQTSSGMAALEVRNVDKIDVQGVNRKFTMEVWSIRGVRRDDTVKVQRIGFPENAHAGCDSIRRVFIS